MAPDSAFSKADTQVKFHLLVATVLKHIQVDFLLPVSMV